MQVKFIQGGYILKRISKKSVTQNLIEINVYKKEFDTIIEIYVDLVNQYRTISDRFNKEDLKLDEKTGYADNSKKSPIILTLETLRKDILLYANTLGLTPAGLKKINDEMQSKKKRVSKLDRAVASLGEV